MNRKSEFLKALAEQVLERSAEDFTEESVLEPWDSLAVISTIALLDDFGHQVPGRDLAKCKTAGDILVLVKP